MTRVVAEAPVRIADVGGWTDTWFGSPGQVCHLAVGPGVRVDAQLVERDGGADPVRLRAPDLPAPPGAGPTWRQQHPLLAHAVAEALPPGRLPEGAALDLTVRSAVPPGASLGTSASVLVALIGALDAVVGTHRTPAEVAAAAHRVETERAGRQAGVQDQWAAALGGCGLLTIDPYPQVHHQPVTLSPATRADLAARTVTVVLGAHDSSAVHREVIASLAPTPGAGTRPGRAARAVLDRMAVLAADAADALGRGDLGTWAYVLRLATDAQSELHPDLVGPDHHRAIALARDHGALGWKVNGAGGAGGSLTTVLPDAATATDLAATLASTEGWTVVPTTPSPGLTIRTEP